MFIRKKYSKAHLIIWNDCIKYYSKILYASHTCGNSIFCFLLLLISACLRNRILSLLLHLYL